MSVGVSSDVWYPIFTKPYSSDGSGSKFFDPGQVGWIFCGSGRFSHFWFGFEFGKFPLKTSNFPIFSLWVKQKSLWVGSKSTQVKGGSASYLLRVKSKLRLGWVRAHLYVWRECVSWEENHKEIHWWLSQSRQEFILNSLLIKRQTFIRERLISEL